MCAMTSIIAKAGSKEARETPSSAAVFPSAKIEVTSFFAAAPPNGDTIVACKGTLLNNFVILV